MTLVKYDNDAYLNVDMIESVTKTSYGLYKAFCNDSSYLISEDAYNAILTYGKATK